MWQPLRRLISLAMGRGREKKGEPVPKVFSVNPKAGF